MVGVLGCNWSQSKWEQSSYLFRWMAGGPREQRSSINILLQVLKNVGLIMRSYTRTMLERSNIAQQTYMKNGPPDVD